MSRLKAFFLSAILAAGLTGCDDSYYSPIPDFPVYLEINTSVAPYNILINSYNKCLVFEKGITVRDRVGYGGIILCSGYDGTIYAFDMACPYEASNIVRVYPPAKAGDYVGQVKCEKCGSVFELGYGVGNPSSGPARKTLRRYKVSISSYNLVVTR